MPLATRAITLGVPPRLHTTKPKAKKTHKKKNRKARKRSADDSDDSDESSDHSVKKKGKSKRRRVETSDDDPESVEEDVEAVEVEVVDLVDDEQEVSIIHLYTRSKLTVMATHNSRILLKTWMTINAVKLCKKSLLKRNQHLIYLPWCQIELPLSST